MVHNRQQCPGWSNPFPGSEVLYKATACLTLYWRADAQGYWQHECFKSWVFPVWIQILNQGFWTEDSHYAQTRGPFLMSSSLTSHAILAFLHKDATNCTAFLAQTGCVVHAHAALVQLCWGWCKMSGSLVSWLSSLQDELFWGGSIAVWSYCSWFSPKQQPSAMTMSSRFRQELL